MKYEDITTWSVSKGVATPKIDAKDPDKWYKPGEAIEEWIDESKLIKQHTYATDAPDGSYSADRFGEIVLEWFSNSVHDWAPIPLCDIETYKHYEAIKLHYSNKRLSIRQFLPFIDQVKEAESSKFGEWIKDATVIINQMVDIMPYTIAPEVHNYIYEAMNIYAANREKKLIQTIKSKINEFKVDQSSSDDAVYTGILNIKIDTIENLLTMLKI